MLPFVLSDLPTDDPEKQQVSGRSGNGSGLRESIRDINDRLWDFRQRVADFGILGVLHADKTTEESEKLYLKGIYAERTAYSLIHQKGREYFAQAAALGHGPSRFHVRFAEFCDATIPYKGLCNDDSVKNWLEYEAERGFNEALYIIGKLCQCDIRSETARLVKYWVRDDGYARGILQIAADRGHIPATFELGCWFETFSYEYDIPDAAIQAVKWVTKAAETGFMPAQAKLGEFYTKGDLAPKDPKRAFHWYQLAATQGDVFSQYTVAECYRDGIGVEQNLDKAIEWYRKSKSYNKSRWALEELGVEV